MDTSFTLPEVQQHYGPTSSSSSSSSSRTSESSEQEVVPHYSVDGSRSTSRASDKPPDRDTRSTSPRNITTHSGAKRGRSREGDEKGRNREREGRGRSGANEERGRYRGGKDRNRNSPQRDGRSSDVRHTNANDKIRCKFARECRKMSTCGYYHPQDEREFHDWKAKQAIQK